MGYIDIHSHILPNLDDGSKSMRQSLDMLKIAVEQGITTIFATPHNMPGKGQPSPEVVQERVEELRKAAEEEGIRIEILIGTEYFFREEVVELLEDEKGITMNDTEFVLVEFDPMVEKVYFRNALRSILTTGCCPIVAHVERYAKVMKDMTFLKEIKKMGALLQINAASVIGDNGFHTKMDVKKLLKEEMVEFIGTDAHSDGKRAPYMEKCAAILTKKYDKDYADALLHDNAQDLLINRE